MATLTKCVVGLSALIAAGAVGMGSLTDARPQPSPASVIADRFVFTMQIPEPAGESVDLTDARRDAAAALAAIALPADAVVRKGDRLDVPTADGATAERSVRHVTLQRRTGPSTSEATRVAVTQVASR
jgi:hypothetical protein